MSNSSIKTKTILTMTDMTQSTELRALEDKRMVKKLLLKCSSVFVLFYLETAKLLSSYHEICMVCLLVGTVYWHKSLQFVKKSNITLLPCLFMILLAVSIII